MAYFTTGALAWGLPRKGLPGVLPLQYRPRTRAHVALSVAHGIAMGTTLALAAAHAAVEPDTAAWQAINGSHALAGFATAGLVLAAGLTLRAR